MTYAEMTKLFRQHELSNPEKHLLGCIVFTEDSFDKKYPEESRSYCVSSDNKAFKPNMGGYSIYASSLNGTDKGVRLDWYMKEENPWAEHGWEVERCYLMTSDKNEEK